MTVPTTKPLSAKQVTDAQFLSPSASITPAVTTPDIAGHMNESRRLIRVDFRQPSSGPTPVRNNRIRPTGAIHLLKNGAATVNRVPVTASLSVGNIVPKSTKNAENSRIQLFNMNAASRDTQE